MAAGRTKNFIATIPMKNEEQVLEVKKVLEQIFGWVVLRGRHSDRKSVVKNWSKKAQNDVPWRLAEYIDVYLHPANPNYNSNKGIQRQNMKLYDTNVVIARALGNMGCGLSDGVKHYKENLSTLISFEAAIKDMQYNYQMKDPKFRRKEMKRKYMNKSYKLKPGDWGFIAQDILDFVQRYGNVTFTEMKEYYDVIIRGNSNMINGGSFIHHLQSLVLPQNALNRRCKRYLYKDLTTKKYKITTI